MTELRDRLLMYIDGEFTLGPKADQLIVFIALVILLILIAAITRFVCCRYIGPLLLRITRRTDTHIDDIILNPKVLRALGNTLPPCIFEAYIGDCFTAVLPTIVRSGIVMAIEISVVVTLTLLIVQLLSSAKDLLATSEKYGEYHLDGIFQAFYLVMYALMSIICVAIFIGHNPSTVLAGLGASAAVLMLVFKDTILGFVASIQLTTNKMLKKEDWVIIDRLGINGIVEEVNLTTVKIRNYDNSVSTVPPYTLVSDSFQNWGEMHDCGARRVRRSINIDVNTICMVSQQELHDFIARTGVNVSTESAEENGFTVTNLTLFRRYLTELIENHPKVVRSPFLLVRQLSPTTQGIPLELWFYFEETSFERFENLAAEFMEHVYAMVPKFGLRIFQEPSGNDIASQKSHVLSTTVRKKSNRRN